MVSEFSRINPIAQGPPDGSTTTFIYAGIYGWDRRAPASQTVHQLKIGATSSLDENTHNHSEDLRTKRKSFTIALPVKVPSMCLFLENNLGSATICFIVAGGHLPPEVARKAKSISPRDGATAYIYANVYADRTAVAI
ncbi:MAG: hypothetical protein Q9217_002234 [Psora testacea]